MRDKAQMIAAAAFLALIALAAAALAQTQVSTTPRMAMRAQTMAADTEIAKLTEQMNHATGEARINAMAQLLNALVQDRTRMHEQMQAMQQMHEMMMRAESNSETPGHAHHPPNAN